MNANLKKYSWQFFWLYLLGYILGMAAVLIIHNSNFQDILVIGLLGFTLPKYLCNKFIKNENRFFNEVEERQIIKRLTWIAYIIVMPFSLVFFGWAVLLRMLMQPSAINVFVKSHFGANDLGAILLQMHPQYLFLIILGTIIFYYYAQYFIIRNAIRRERKKYEKGNLIVEAME